MTTTSREWVKASERTPDESIEMISLRFNGIPFGGEFNRETSNHYFFVNKGPVFHHMFHLIEWLEEKEVPVATDAEIVLSKGFLPGLEVVTEWVNKFVMDKEFTAGGRRGMQVMSSKDVSTLTDKLLKEVKKQIWRHQLTMERHPEIILDVLRTPSQSIPSKEVEEGKDFLLHLVDTAWGYSRESEQVPSTDVANIILSKARSTFHPSESGEVVKEETEQISNWIYDFIQKLPEACREGVMNAANECFPIHVMHAGRKDVERDTFVQRMNFIQGVLAAYEKNLLSASKEQPGKETAEQVFDRHCLKFLNSETGRSYENIDEIKSTPEYLVTLAAMEEYANQFKGMSSKGVQTEREAIRCLFRDSMNAAACWAFDNHSKLPTDFDYHLSQFISNYLDKQWPVRSTEFQATELLKKP